VVLGSPFQGIAVLPLAVPSRSIITIVSTDYELCVLLRGLRNFLFGSLLIPPTVKRVKADDPGFYMSGVFG
jgi:hypothetical protein